MKKSRSLQLDFLRGIAILLVLFSHAPIGSRSGIFTHLTGAMVRFGWTGVDLFFVLSGFLVGGLIFAELRKGARFDAKRFLIRRGFKIWPAYAIFIAFFFAKLL